MYLLLIKKKLFSELSLNLNATQHFIAMVITQALTPQVFSIQISTSYSYNFLVS